MYHFGSSLAILKQMNTLMDIQIGTVDIFVISQPKWLKFGLQAHLGKMLGHTKFQLSISCTFRVTKLLVTYLVISTISFIIMKVQEIESCNFAILISTVPI